MGAIDLSSFLWPDAAQRRQPKGSVQLDPSYGLRPECIFVGSNSGFDQVGYPLISAASVVRSISTVGPVVTPTGSAGQGLSRTGGKSSAQTKCTFIAVVKRSGTTAYQVIASSSCEATGAGFSLQDSVGDGVSIGLQKSGSAAAPAIITLPSDSYYTVIASTNQTTGEYYVLAQPIAGGSVLRAAASSFTETSTAGNGTYGVGMGKTVDGSFNGSIALSVMAFDFLPEVAAKKLLDNPWQIFAAPSIPLFTTSAGVPTDVLTASSIIAASAVVGSPSIGQAHALTAPSIGASSTVAAPTVSQRHVLAASGIAASATVAQPVITQRHALTASAISASATVGAPTLIEIAAGILSALPIVSAPAIVGAPAITQKHALTAGAISAGPATFGTPTLAQQHALMAQGIAASATVGAPALSGEGGFSGSISDADITRIAAAVLAALQATAIPVNTTQIVGRPILGNGTTQEFYV